MSFGYLHIFPRWLFAFALMCLTLTSMAQPAGLLYDPEPPADSAYVRVIHVSRESAVDVLVDGRVRVRKLASGDASDYLVLKAGQHTVALRPAGKTVPTMTTNIEVVRGRAITVAFTTLKSDVAPVLFEDKANSNKLKALLAVYHLEPKIGSIDVTTANGATKVFTGLIYGAYASIQVNPISIDLIAVKSDGKVAQTKASLAMSQGGSYSIFILPGLENKTISKIVQNRIEKLSGN